jgi:diacylglycerol kinase (ATP)
MERLVSAFHNSIRAFGVLARRETAFQQEIVLFLLSLPIGWFVATTWRGYACLVGVVVVLMIVEVLNTAIEATCDALSLEFHAEIRLAKDCGSLAVLLTMLIVVGVWGFALADRFFGTVP